MVYKDALQNLILINKSWKLNICSGNTVVYLFFHHWADKNLTFKRIQNNTVKMFSSQLHTVWTETVKLHAGQVSVKSSAEFIQKTNES